MKSELMTEYDKIYTNVLMLNMPMK